MSYSIVGVDRQGSETIITVENSPYKPAEDWKGRFASIFGPIPCSGGPGIQTTIMDATEEGFLAHLKISNLITTPRRWLDSIKVGDLLHPGLRVEEEYGAVFTIHSREATN